MTRIFWDKYSIDKKCTELGIEFLSKDYNQKELQDFKCSCGNTFSRKLSNVLSNNQVLCLDCSREALAKKNRIRALDNFNELLEMVNKSDFEIEILATFEEYKNNKTPLKTRCRCGNIYYPNANSLKRSLNTQCKKCGDKQAGLSKRKSKKEIIDFVENTNYTYLNYKYSGKHWIEVKCENNTHNCYWVDWGNFYMGNRCPQCNISKGETRVKNFLIDNNIKFEEEFKINELRGINNGLLRFDFKVYFEDKEFFIEYDGEQHFKPKFGEYEFVRTVENDKLKNVYCQENKLNLLRIKYTDYENIEKILKKHFKIN